MLLKELFEGKLKQETAEQAFARYESLKKSNAAPELLAKVLALANSLMDEKFKQMQRTMEAKHSGEGWWEAVKKLYKIQEQGNKWIIVSNARDWKQDKEWEYDTKYEAQEQLQKLIGYKHADRKKGVGDVDKDYERVDVVVGRRERDLKESFWAVTTKYRDDTSKNGEDFFNIPGVPGGTRVLAELEEMLRQSKGKITDAVIAFADKNLKGKPGPEKLRNWLKWVKDNNRKIKTDENGTYLSY